MSREAPRQVWLPGSGVWAALGPAVQPGGKDARSEAPNSSSGRRRRGPQQGEPARGGRKRSREPSPSHLNASGSRQDSQEHERDAPAAPAAGSPPAAAAAARHTVALTGYALQQDKEDSDVEEVEASPTCPICLVDIIDLSDKAVVTPCMHEFCHDCIWRWVSNHKRVCPLCKARVGSVLYDITPSGTYKERDVPPSPKVRSVGSGDAGAADAPLLQRLQDFLGVAGLVDPYEQQQQQVRLRQQSGSGRVGYGSRERQAQQAQQAQQQRGGAAAPAGPRPYFYRLQQRFQAGGYRPGSSWSAAAGGSGLGEGPVSVEDYALLFRRQVYDNDLWAVPLSTQTPRISLGSGTPQERRLTEWIERELRALLQTDDVTIIRGFVMGLLVAYGLEPFSAAELEGGSSSQAQQAQQAQQAARQAAVTARQRAAAMVAAAGGGSGTGGRGGPSGSEAGSAAALSSNPVEALQPFLYEHSEHFWHELRCFATAPPYTIATYDRTVQYRRRPVAPAAPAAGAAGTAAGAPTWRPSRWDQRQRASHPQQAQQPSRPIQAARVVHQAGGVGSRAGQPAETDADAPRRRGGSSRNPSPPAPLSRAVAEGGAASLPQHAQHAQQQHQRGEEWHSGRSSSPRRSRSRKRRRRRSASRGRQRRRSGSREDDRSRSSSGSGSRYRSRHHSRHSSHRRQHSPRRSRGRSRSRERRRCYVSPSQYIAGQEDGGDRWAME